MSNLDKTALMYGAGSIGRGFLGQLFYLSGYETCFVDVDETLVNQLNADKQYEITVATEFGYESAKIGNARAVHGMDSDKVADEISRCEIMATAVGVNILPKVAKTIAAGIDKRFVKKPKAPLDIIVCENISDSGNYLKDLVSSYIKNKEYFEDSIGFVSASVGRMVPVSTNTDSPKIVVESYNELPVDKDALKTDVSGIKNFKPISPFAIEKYKKYFMHNMSHAIVAYLGFLKGYEYLWQAMGDASIKCVAEKALNESIDAICACFSADRPSLNVYARDLLNRYSNKYLNDTVARVGRDPKRKLQAGDRLIGAALFCIDNNITPDYILYGVAAAFCFDVPEDVSSPEVRSYVSEYGIEAAITKYTGIEPDSPLYPKIQKIYSILNCRK